MPLKTGGSRQHSKQPKQTSLSEIHVLQTPVLSSIISIYFFVLPYFVLFLAVRLQIIFFWP